MRLAVQNKGDEFKNAILEAIPHLRAFARALARDAVLADDLVQDAIVNALSHRDQFKPGTNLKGWLIIILRNSFFNEVRKSRHKFEVAVDFLPDIASVKGNQEARMELRDFRRAFAKLPAAQREALTLVGASGFSYEEAAELVGCPVGTLKSRVSRARAELQHAMEGGENPHAHASGRSSPRAGGIADNDELTAPPILKAS